MTGRPGGSSTPLEGAGSRRTLYNGYINEVQVILFKYNTTSNNYITSIFFVKFFYFADRNYNAQQIYIITCKYCKLILADAAAAAEDPA